MTNMFIAASIFENLCNTDGSGLYKIAIIRKMPKGYWGIYSRKGKLLGKYKTKQEAVKRLRQIEFFKHKKASENDTYTSILRQLNKDHDPAVVREFRQIFKNTFDDALLQGKDDPEGLAFDAAMKFFNTLNDDVIKKNFYVEKFLHKYAGNELGNPQDVGSYLANLIKFIMRKISSQNRSKSIHNLKNKIYMLNEFELASKKMPPAASIGQSLVIIKHLMFGKDPLYVRQVLNSITANL